MKKITFLLFTLITFLGFSQQVIVQDFENSPSVASFEGLTSATILTDPTDSGRGNVFELVTNTSGNPWQGAEVVQPNDSALDLTNNITVNVDVYSTVPFSPMLKVESSEGAPASANTQSHTGSGWETLTFTFNTGSDGTTTASGVYTKLVFFPNRNSADTGWGDPILDATVLFDNVEAFKTTVDETVIIPPATAAPTPPERDSGDVYALFSDAYTTNPPQIDVFGNAKFETAQIEGTSDNIFYLEGIPGEGFQYNFFASSSSVDLSNMTHFHVDVWVDGTLAGGELFTAQVINYDSADAVESNNFYQATLSSTGQWISVDVPITSFVNAAGNANYDNVKLLQLVMQGPTAFGPLFIDNVYFYGSGNGDGGGDSGSNGNGDLLSLTFDDAASIDVFTGIANAAEPTDEAEVSFNANGNGTGALQLQGVNIDGNDGRNFSFRYENATFNFGGNSEIVVTFDAKFEGAYAGAAFHVQNQVPRTGGGAPVTINNFDLQSQINDSSWSTIEFTLSDAEFDGSAEGLFIMDFQIAAGATVDAGGTVLIDNIKISSPATASTDNNALLGFALYPNPANQQITISAKETIENAQIVNAIGRTIKRISINTTQKSIDVSDLASGVYMIRYNVGNKIGTYKFIKQ